MATFLLTWNPYKWLEPDEIEKIKATASGETWPKTWSVGARNPGIRR